MLLQDVGPNVSPDVGQRTLPQALDTLASKEPDALYGFFPTANDLTIASWRRIAMKEVANAVNHLSWWIALNIGTSTNNETLAYMGPLDLRYFAMALACVKTGHKVGIKPLPLYKLVLMPRPGHLPVAEECITGPAVSPGKIIVYQVRLLSVDGPRTQSARDPGGQRGVEKLATAHA